MVKTIEGIEVKNRTHFKNGLKAIDNNFSITFKGQNALVSYIEGYEINIERKAKALSGFKAFLVDFRQYQFNQAI